MKRIKENDGGFVGGGGRIMAENGKGGRRWEWIVWVVVVVKLCSMLGGGCGDG